MAPISPSSHQLTKPEPPPPPQDQALTCHSGPIKCTTHYVGKFTFERLRRSLAILGQSAPASEVRDQDLRIECEEMLLSKLVCVPTMWRPEKALGFAIANNSDQRLSHSRAARESPMWCNDAKKMIKISSLHVPPGRDGISLVSRSISVIKSMNERVTYKKIVSSPK
ncbi:hypothetical protein ACTXT7_001349 [Hymenolepis weldensis]